MNVSVKEVTSAVKALLFALFDFLQCEYKQDLVRTQRFDSRNVEIDVVDGRRVFRPTNFGDRGGQKVLFLPRTQLCSFVLGLFDVCVDLLQGYPEVSDVAAILVKR